jgi:hypothetical protein
MYHTNGMAPGYHHCIAVVPQKRGVGVGVGESMLTASSGKKAARSSLSLLINVTTMGGCDNTSVCDYHFYTPQKCWRHARQF